MNLALGKIYESARTSSGYTQERWAEYIGVSTEAVRNYELGNYLPTDEVLLKMADISGMKALPYWHLSQKSRVAAEILPKLEGTKSLPEAVLALLVQIDDFQEDGMQELIRIAADGKVTRDEAAIFNDCLLQLQNLMQKAFALTYAEETP
jgi:transcriptional regulator with XRE-family HTH domain